ncbi:methyltransferase domain-containing protein [Chryseobacterium sp. WLY505]|uniref:methyltransferase domain-containing protein n=1 Tax=Chryseobacterium sp. WLY505 TaxID=3068892 RepID=UPI0027966B64|nr:methyltransferase domain-containing protein [Chryseobacterium sp. WLY505]MDQ1855733.1 methyltransferase domain-containing protein [Chryseobacterium sp. WLY505]
MGKKILDVCCGSKMMWFNKQHPDVMYSDKRKGIFEAYGNKTIVDPDVVADFTNLPFSDNTFYIVVMDPPHSKWLGNNTILGQKYGQLLSNWEIEIKEGFKECMRVLKPNGTLIFKWNDKDVKLSKLLEVIEHEPLFGHTSGKHGKTIWLCFMK